MRDVRFAPWVLALGLAVSGHQPVVSAQGAPIARATLRSCTDGSLVGTATFVEAPSSEGVKNVKVVLSAQNLTPGKHAVHFHEIGACTPTCAAAGSHLDLGPFGNNVPVTANHPFHSGDLINVDVGPQGSGAMSHITSRITLSPGPLSVFDSSGSALVIHALPDLYCPDPTDPNCAGGGRVACGVVEAVPLPPPTILALTATPNVLWPANSSLVPVAIDVTVSGDINFPPVCAITIVTSNEPLDSSDSVVTDPLHLTLRAERNGSGTGRLYSITVTCTNASQLSDSAVVTVLVPHDRR